MSERVVQNQAAPPELPALRTECHRLIELIARRPVQGKAAIAMTKMQRMRS